MLNFKLMKKIYTKKVLKGILKTTFLLMIICICGRVSATHFRYGNLTWSRDIVNPLKIQFKLTESWRRGFYWLNYSSTNVLNPVPGNVINFSNNFPLNFGDGTSENVKLLITSYSPTDDWIFGEFITTHTFSGIGTYTAFMEGFARLGGPQPSGPLQNNGYATFRIQSIVTVDLNNDAPVSTLPPIVNMIINKSPASYQIPAADPNGDVLTFSLAAPSSFTQAGETLCTQPKGFNVSPTGLMTFITTNSFYTMAIGQFYNAVVTVTDSKGAAINLDFLIEITGSSNPPVFDYTVTPTNNFSYLIAPGTNVNYSVNASDPDVADFVTLFGNGLPIGSVMTPLLPFSGAVNAAVQSNFSWTPNLSQVGTYVTTFIAQDPQGVQANTTVKITVACAPSSITTSGDTTFCDGGSVDLTANTGSTYLWNTGQTTKTITAASSGLYTVTVTAANGCVAKKSITVTKLPAVSLTATGVNVSCKGAGDGSINTTSNGTVVIKNSANNIVNATGLVPGNYTVSASNPGYNGGICLAVPVIVNISEPPLLTLSATGTNLNCNGAMDGAINAVSNGSVVIKDAANNIVAATGLSAGTYTVSASLTGNNGANCTVAPVLITIKQPDAVTLSASGINISCNGAANGQLIVASNGTIIVKDNAGNITGTTGLIPGTYTVSATMNGFNGATCSAIPVNVLITQPDVVSLSATGTNISCNGNADGIINAQSNGTILIKDDGGNTVASSGLPPGNYTVSATIAGNNGVTCSAISIKILIIEPPAVSLTALPVNVSCNGGADGAINANSNGTIVIKNAGNIIVGNSGLPAGTYTVSATKAGNNGALCSATSLTVLIKAPDAVTLSGTVTNVSCNGLANGSINVVSNGTVLVKDGMGNVVNTTGLPPGNYTVSASMAGNNNSTCYAIPLSLKITEPDAITLTATGSNITCNGAATGTINTVSNGTVTIKNTAGNIVSNSGLPSGTYLVSASKPGNNGAICSIAPVTVNITQVTPILTHLVNNNPVLYFGYALDQTATITSSPTGGVGPYTVSFSMNRPLHCNRVTSSGDEVWLSGPNTFSNLNITCPSSGSSVGKPVSTSINSITSISGYSVSVTLDSDAVVYVTITDANFCQKVDSTKIHAEDVRCFAGSSGNYKVSICHKTGSITNPCVSICVDKSAVAEHLAHGDFLGKCTANCLAPGIAKTGEIFLQSLGNTLFQPTALSITVKPNPSSNYFNVLISGNINSTVSVRVMDEFGRVIQSNQKFGANTTLHMGDKWVAGVYFIEAMQGNERKMVKIIKGK